MKTDAILSTNRSTDPRIVGLKYPKRREWIQHPSYPYSSNDADANADLGGRQ